MTARRRDADGYELPVEPLVLGHSDPFAAFEDYTTQMDAIVHSQAYKWSRPHPLREPGDLVQEALAELWKVWQHHRARPWHDVCRIGSVAIRRRFRDLYLSTRKHDAPLYIAELDDRDGATGDATAQAACARIAWAEARRTLTEVEAGAFDQLLEPSTKTLRRMVARRTGVRLCEVDALLEQVQRRVSASIRIGRVTPIAQHQTPHTGAQEATMAGVNVDPFEGLEDESPAKAVKETSEGNGAQKPKRAAKAKVTAKPAARAAKGKVAAKPKAAKAKVTAKPKAKAPKVKAAAKTKAPKVRAKAPAAGHIYREGTKAAKLLAMLARKDGVSMPEMQAGLATGSKKWQKHSVRGMLAVFRGQGYTIEREGFGNSRYFMRA